MGHFSKSGVETGENEKNMKKCRRLTGKMTKDSVFVTKTFDRKKEAEYLRRPLRVDIDRKTVGDGVSELSRAGKLSVNYWP